MPADQCFVLLFGAATLGVIYPFLIYPLLLWIQTRGGGRVGPARGRGRLVPFSVVIPACNEEATIGDKLANTREAVGRCPVGSEIIVVSDGSTDRTSEIVRGFGGAVRLVELPRRSGIQAALSAGAAASRYDVLVFSDADIQLDRNALRRMVRHFSDEAVGGVCGSTAMRFRRGSGLGTEGLNVALRRWVRERQSRVNCLIGADGSNWAVRKGLAAFPSPPPLAEDLVIPLGIVGKGHRFVFERGARAFETSPGKVGDEFHRKTRTIAGGIQAMLYCGWMFSPGRRALAFHYVSWKLAKYAVGPWALLAFGASVPLAGAWRPFRAPVVAGLLFLLLAAAGGLSRLAAPSRTPRLLNGAWYLLLVGVAPAVAVWQLCLRRTTVLWRIAPRGPAPARPTIHGSGGHPRGTTGAPGASPPSARPAGLSAAAPHRTPGPVERRA